jgi:hypothetical protein
MHLETRTVSRKTPGDGRLEISDATAARLREWLPAAEFALHVNGAAGRGRLEVMPCGCDKAATAGRHEHVFVEGELLRTLAPGCRVGVSVDEHGVTVETMAGLVGA